MTITLTDTPRIYVASLAHYNAGTLKGVWLDLEDYWDEDALMEAITEYLHKWGVEEYAVHDYEGFPSTLYSEYMGTAEFAHIYEMLEAAEDHSWGAVFAYVDLYGDFDARRFEDAYLGEADSPEDYAYDYIASTGMLRDVPDTMRQYFDYEAFARDLFRYDLSFENGYVFNDCM